MKKTPVSVNLEEFPRQFHPLLAKAVYDSSCSPEARVWFLEPGYYLKRAPKGALQREAEMTRFLHEKQLAAEVAAYESLEQDWLLTAAVPGEDCTHEKYLADPKRLCETTAALLRQLHGLSPEGCPVGNHTKTYLQTVGSNYAAGRFDPVFFPGITAEEAFALVEEHAKYLKTDTLLHGDYCLPNIMLDDWKFSAFIDLDHGGAGDRHVDVFWGIWTLQFNLHTDAYAQRFLDAYGRENIEPELLRVVAAAECFG